MTDTEKEQATREKLFYQAFYLRVKEALQDLERQLELKREPEKLTVPMKFCEDGNGSETHRRKQLP
ncbi:MAG TPA: hypothetical protein VMW09_03470 [Desulfatiglandales bacterium]|nr:hypothetical protein [Desulfatiglandales bacterium]